VYTRNPRQHCNCEYYRSGNKRALHLREIRLAAKYSENVVTVVENCVEGKWGEEGGDEAALKSLAEVILVILGFARVRLI